MNLHPVSLDYLQQIVNTARPMHPDDLPVAVERDLADKRLIELRGGGKKIQVFATPAGLKVLAELRPEKKEP